MGRRARRRRAGLRLGSRAGDSAGRIVVPKPSRAALGLVAGSTVDISRYGAGLQLVPTGRTARLVHESGLLVATGDTPIDDDAVFGDVRTHPRGAQPARDRRRRGA
ncbi:MAG: AbrB/MazE/SpoVT family DNA-binding domain-containing protein [Actinomycetales bacterium]|nr:AbrB/MazE/SpoVT family DNA-binding domain-containing protein [Actinomycetales bacterium]